MENFGTDNEELNVCANSQNKILLNLERIYIESQDVSCDLENFASNITKTRRESLSPVVDDLLMTLNSPKLRKFNESNVISCYRCKHYLNIPANFLQGSYDRISDCTEEYTFDITFVQAIVWLKSAIANMKDISAEKFHLMFHKLWNNNRNQSTATQARNIKHVEGSNLEYCVREISQKSNENDNQSSEDDSTFCDSVDLVFNINNNVNVNKFQSSNFQNEMGEIPGFDKDHNIFPDSRSNSQMDDSNFATENHSLKNCIIPESDNEYSPSPDLFDDSSQSQKTNDKLQSEKENISLQEDDSIAGNFPQKISLTLPTQFSDIILNEGININSPSNNSQERNSFIVEFLAEDSLQLNFAESLKKTETLKFFKNSLSSLQQRKDDTLFFRDEEVISQVEENFQLKCNSDSPIRHVPDDYLDEDTFGFIQKNISPCQKDDSAYSTHNTDTFSQDTTMTKINWICNEEQSSPPYLKKLKVHEKYDRVADFVETTRSPEINNRFMPEDSENGKEIRAVKRKLEYEINGSSRKDRLRKDGKLSSELLNFTLDALNVDDVALESVKVILSFLQNEKITKKYMKRRCWENTLEKEAVNAVLNFCDILEAEKKTDVCTQEIFAAIKNTLERIIESTELTKQEALWTYQISIILELCNSIKVCTQAIDYLTAKVKSCENLMLNETMEKGANIYKVVKKLHVIFYALTISLEKYRVVFPHKRESQSDVYMIPAVVDLWKRDYLNPECVIREETTQMKEERWQTILDDFAVIAADDFVRFADRSRALSRILMFE